MPEMHGGPTPRITRQVRTDDGEIVGDRRGDGNVFFAVDNSLFADVLFDPEPGKTGLVLTETGLEGLKKLVNMLCP